MTFIRGQTAIRLWLLALILTLPGRGIGLRAHEVDQYDLPEGKRLADLGDYWDQTLYDAVRHGVDEVNASIDRTEKYNHIPAIREAAIRKLQSPSRLVRSVREQLPSALMTIERTEFMVHMPGQVDLGPDQMAGYFAPLHDGTFTHMPLWPDIRQLSRIALLRSSLIRVHDTYLGTDKLGHFVGMGYWYYTFYLDAVSHGKSRPEAITQAVEKGSRGPISEHGLLGMAVTGVVSNADMAANYLGMKYFLNITEPVMLKGRRVPPMVVLQEGRWRLAEDVRPDSEHFALFISEHLDEVLNPSEYEPGMRRRIREQISERGPSIIDWYAGDDAAKRTPEFFDAALARCLTYYGEDYGHFGNLENLITISDSCFPSRDEAVLANYGPGRPPSVQSSVQTLPATEDVSVCLQELGPSLVHRENPYMITVTNNRPTPLDRVEVVAAVPGALLPTEVGQQGVFDSTRREIRWAIPWLPVGGNATLSFQAYAVRSGVDATLLTVRSAGAELMARQQEVLVVNEAIAAGRIGEPKAVEAREAPYSATRPWQGSAWR